MNSKHEAWFMFLLVNGDHTIVKEKMYWRKHVLHVMINHKYKQ